MKSELKRNKILMFKRRSNYMKSLDAKYYPNEDYRELFNIMVDSNKCTITCIGITNDGTFLYINERLANNSSAYWIDREFFVIDRDEFCYYLEIARAKGEVEKAIKNGRTTAEELEQLSRA